MRGLTRSMMRLIIPPLPAASRPSKMITMRALVALTQSWSLTNSTCSLKISASYFCLPIFGWLLTPPDLCLFLDCLPIVRPVCFDLPLAQGNRCATWQNHEVGLQRCWIFMCLRSIDFSYLRHSRQRYSDGRWADAIGAGVSCRRASPFRLRLLTVHEIAGQ